MFSFFFFFLMTRMRGTLPLVTQPQSDSTHPLSKYIYHPQKNKTRTNIPAFFPCGPKLPHPSWWQGGTACGSFPMDPDPLGKQGDHSLSTLLKDCGRWMSEWLTYVVWESHSCSVVQQRKEQNEQVETDVSGVTLLFCCLLLNLLHFE